MRWVVLRRSKFKSGILSLVSYLQPLLAILFLAECGESAPRSREVRYCQLRVFMVWREWWVSSLLTGYGGDT